MPNKLRDFYESVKIDKKPDASVLQAQEERKRSLLEQQEAQITSAMEIITKNKDEGYCILNYSEDPYDIAKQLRDGGFHVKEKRFSPLIGHRGRLERYALIVSWQVFDDATFEKIESNLCDEKRRQYSRFMSQD